MDFDVVVDHLVSWPVNAEWRSVHDLVAEKLAGDKALDTLETEVEEFGETSDLTRKRVVRSLEAAAKQDPEFAARLAALTQAGSAVVIGGDVHAEGGSLAAGQITGGVTFNAHPPQPGR